jgi:hypothetical protein
VPTITNLQSNWTSVGFTPTGGSLTSFNRVNGVDIDPGGELLPYKGDADRYPTVITNQNNHPRITLRSGNVALLQGFASGTAGVFTATFNDAAGVVGGAIVYTIQAVVQNAPAGGQHAQYGEGQLVMMGRSVDGVTSPIAFTRI